LCAPDRLVGRDHEIGALHAAFERAARGRAASMVISGMPGVGKTSLVNELRATVSAHAGRFVSAKFDQYRRDADSGTVLQALRALARLLLTEPEQELTGLCRRLREALSSNAGLAATVLPELGTLLAVSPQPMPDDPVQVEARLREVVRGVVSVVASVERPLVMVIDDLQWASRSSVALFDVIMTDEHLEGLLLIGLYRDAEVDAAHPLSGALQRWQRLEQPPVFMQLSNLSSQGVAELLADMLRIDAARAAELAASVMPQTLGNPFDTIELVNALRRAGSLRLSERGWDWDVAQIRRYVGGSNVMSLLQERIAALPAETREAFDVMSCLGGDLALALLAAATGVTSDVLLRDLSPATDDGLLVLRPGDDGAEEGRVCFAHDRVQQATYARLAPDRRTALHLRLARRLAALPEHAGVAAEQYLHGVASVTEVDERCVAARLFHRAGGHALLTNSAAAARFWRAALALIEPIASAQEAGFITDLQIGLHAALCGLGQHGDAEQVYQSIAVRCTDLTVLARVAGLHMHSLTSLGRQGDAVALGISILKRLAQFRPELWSDDLGAGSLDELVQWAGTLDAAADLARPEVQDPMVMAAVHVLYRAGTPAYFSGPVVTSQFLFLCKRLWEKHGPCAGLVPTIALGPVVVVNLYGDYRTGYRLARHVLDVSAARGYEPETSEARQSFGFFSAHWHESMEEGAKQLRLSREGLLPWGNLLTASLTYSGTMVAAIDGAGGLAAAQAELDAGMALSARAGAAHSQGFMLCNRQLLRALRGETQPIGHFNDAEFDENTFLATANSFVGSLYHTNRALSAALFGDDEGLLMHAEAAIAITARQAPYRAVQARVLKALALAVEAHRQPTAQREPILAQLQAFVQWFEARSQDSAGGFLPLLRWMQAELAWAEGNMAEAARRFDVALDEMRHHERPWHRALAAERAARFYEAAGFPQARRRSLIEAFRRYRDWGAAAKAAQLEAQHHFLRQQQPSAAGTGQSARLSGESLDLLALLRAAQAMSSETRMDRLMARVEELLGALTGATRAVLVLRNDEDQWVLPRSEGEPLSLDEAVQQHLLPLSAFRYVERTQRPLVVENALRDDRFSRDPYLLAHADTPAGSAVAPAPATSGRPGGPFKQCSLLLVPVLIQSRLRAVVVLENTVSQGVFTANRLDAVLLISGQVAASLENALLYASLERKVADRTQALEQANRQLEELSATDPLTGLPNRRRFNVVLEAEWHRAQRAGQPLAVAMVDIDQFKLYNDRYGHVGGDACLRRVAQTIGAAVRPASDLAARYGGEEFALVLPLTDEAGAQALGERLRAKVAALQLEHASSALGFVSISIGVASWTPAPQDRVEQLVEAADAALYQSKAEGRNRVTLAGAR
jgi:diguanylate cyclase (GGDEF)-like protein